MPRQLALDSLGYIYCRSTAEKDTLLYLLGTELRQRYQPRIVSSARSMLFFRSHTFVETANLTKDGVHFYFSPDTVSPGPFDMLVEVFDYQTLQTHTRHAPEATARGPLAVRFRRPLTEYLVRLTLDGHLAYANGFRDMEIPF